MREGNRSVVQVLFCLNYPCADGRMAGMKFQFSMSTLMLVLTVAAISCVGMLALMKIDGRNQLGLLPGFVGFASPLLVPCAFVGFAGGRRALTVRMVAVLTIAEAAAIGVAYSVSWLYGDW